MLVPCIYIYIYAYVCPKILMSACFAAEVALSADALRMRCRRMCEKKATGRANVDSSIMSDYREGGTKREMLEIALLEAIAKHGVNRQSYKKVKASQCFSLQSSTFYIRTT